MFRVFRVASLFLLVPLVVLFCEKVIEVVLSLDHFFARCGCSRGHGYVEERVLEKQVEADHADSLLTELVEAVLI